jgi:hypothetical protein
MEKLTPNELINLIKSVFPRLEHDRQLAILVDVPRHSQTDNPDWKRRREICLDWYLTLRENINRLDLEAVHLIAYPEVGSNNAELPEKAFNLTTQIPPRAEDLTDYGESVAFDEVFSQFQLFLAPTEYSTTAPLKNAAKQFGFRAGTMPGFSSAMIPALRIDYQEVSRRVAILKDILDPAQWAEVVFMVDQGNSYQIRFDLHNRTAHLSSGRFPEPGIAGNVPSGETYIVPYEGESDPSQTCGILPVQLDQQVLLFNIQENRAVEVKSESGMNDLELLNSEKDYLKREPAYGNMAELGFGVLGDFGLDPIGEILLDEKLGFHVAFGRSDHFGGIVGPSDFSSPAEVIHLDRVYIPSLQPRIEVKSLVLGENGRQTLTVMKDGQYQLF